jgi:hypothetical protein
MDVRVEIVSLRGVDQTQKPASKKVSVRHAGVFR